MHRGDGIRTVIVGGIMGKRNLYLKTTPVQEAVDIYKKEVKKRVKLQYETIPVTEFLMRLQWMELQ